MSGTTKNGYLKEHGTEHPYAPKTKSTLVDDVEKSRALSASLRLLIESGALGYPAFNQIDNFAIGQVVFHDRKLWKFTSAHTAGAWNPSEVVEWGIKELLDELVSGLAGKLDKTGYSASAGVGYADVLKWMLTRGQQAVSDSQRDFVQTAGGDESIDSSKGGVLLGISARSDFAATSIISSGFNLLRLQSASGVAIAVGEGWAFPVPALSASADTVGKSTANNGVLFTDSEGENLTPTVRFLAGSAAPTSDSDGETCSYVELNSRRHYICSEPGWLIVTGITWAETCAHIGWSGRYDEFVSPTDSDDAGTIISLANLGTLLTVGNGGNFVADRAVRLTDTSMQKQTNVGTANNLTWVDVAETDSEGVATGNYIHTATIAGLNTGGAAEILLNGGSAWIALAVDGNSVSFVDTNASVASGYLVKYDLFAKTTASINVGTVVTIEDRGITVVYGASGAAVVDWRYSQGWNDALAGEPDKRAYETGILSEAVARLTAEVEDLKTSLRGYQALIEAHVLDAREIRMLGVPLILFASTAGAPSAANVPDNWPAGKTWRGGAYFRGQFYLDLTNGKLYTAKANSITATSDWAVLN